MENTTLVLGTWDLDDNLVGFNFGEAEFEGELLVDDGTGDLDFAERGGWTDLLDEGLAFSSSLFLGMTFLNSLSKTPVSFPRLVSTFGSKDLRGALSWEDLVLSSDDSC